MITLSILIMLVGSVLGIRLKVLSLIPAMALAFIMTIGIGAAHGDHLGSIILAAIVSATCLQIGYLGGTVARVSVADKSAPRPREFGRRRPQRGQ